MPLRRSHYQLEILRKRNRNIVEREQRDSTRFVKVRILRWCPQPVIGDYRAHTREHGNACQEFVSGVDFVTLRLGESLSSPILTSLPMRVLLELLSRPAGRGN